MIPKVGALGGQFKIIYQAQLEVFLCTFGAFVLGGTEIPLCGGSTLQAAAEQIELSLWPLSYRSRSFFLKSGMV